MKLFNEFCLRDIAHGAATSPLNDLDPSDAQLNAGNYKKGQVRLHGMPISIENPQGSIRRGVDPTGVKWACTMHAHYGYFKGTIGADGGHVDCFLGPDCENPKCPVFVVNQIRVHGEEFGWFDEHKVMVGYCDRNSAIAGYLINFSPGWKGLGSIEETTIHGLRNWLSHGDTQAPFEYNTIKESKQMKLFEEAWNIVTESISSTQSQSLANMSKLSKTQFKASDIKSLSSILVELAKEQYGGQFYEVCRKRFMFNLGATTKPAFNLEMLNKKVQELGGGNVIANATSDINRREKLHSLIWAELGKMNPKIVNKDDEYYDYFGNPKNHVSNPKDIQLK